jgi:hypothetical protein
MYQVPFRHLYLFFVMSERLLMLIYGESLTFLHLFLQCFDFLSLASNFKGTVRPDLISLRMVPLDRSLFGHQPLYGFNGFNFLI